MSYLIEHAFSKVAIECLEHSTQLLQFTVHEDLQTSVTYSVLIFKDEFVLLFVNDTLYELDIDKMDNMVHLFNVLQIDCHSIDITSNILFNHVIPHLLVLPLFMLPVLSMNIYTSKFTLQSIMAGVPLPLPQLVKEQVTTRMDLAHISAQCAKSVLSL